MSYKTNPVGNRLGISLSWKAPREILNFNQPNSNLQNWVQMYMLIKEYLRYRGMKLLTFRYEWHALAYRDQSSQYFFTTQTSSGYSYNTSKVKNLSFERFAFFAKSNHFLKMAQKSGSNLITNHLLTKKRAGFMAQLVSLKAETNTVRTFAGRQERRIIAIQNINQCSTPKTLAFTYYRYLPTKKPKKGKWRLEKKDRRKRKPWYRRGRPHLHDIWDHRMTVVPKAYNFLTSKWGNRLEGLKSRRAFRGAFKPTHHQRKFYRSVGILKTNRRPRPQRVWMRQGKKNWRQRLKPRTRTLLPYATFAYRYRFHQRFLPSKRKFKPEPWKRGRHRRRFEPKKFTLSYKRNIKYANQDLRRPPLLLNTINPKIKRGYFRYNPSLAPRELTELLRPYPLLLNKNLFRHKLTLFLAKYTTAIPFLKIKTPRIRTRKLRKVPERYLSKLQRVISQQPHYINTMRIFYLLKLYKDPTIWVDHFASELAKVKKKRLQWPLIKSFNVFIKCRLLFHKIFQYTRIGVFGRINGSSRTRVHYLLARRRDNEPTHRFLAPIQFAQAQSLARIGVFGIKMWNFADSLKVERQRNPILKHNIALYKQIRDEEA